MTEALSELDRKRLVKAAVEDGRLLASSAGKWEARLAKDPNDAQLLAMLAPCLTPAVLAMTNRTFHESQRGPSPASTRNVTPAVRNLANRLGVNLDSVVATGPGGRVTTKDVRAAAPARPAVMAATAYSAPGLATEQRGSHFNANRKVQYDGYARNPLADDYRQVNPTVYGMALRGGPPPTLFSAGDLPIYTASGNPPSALQSLPWQVRHPAARADQATWASLFEDYSHDGSRKDAIRKADRASMAFGSDSGNASYAERMRQWLMNSGNRDYNDPEVMARAQSEMAAFNRKETAQRKAQEAEANRLKAQAAKAQADALEAAHRLHRR